MRVAPALVLVPFVFLTAFEALGAPDVGAASVAAASKALESARAAMVQAVKRIEADPPSNADLDAAHAAVNAVKDAIDSGAAREQEDLDYARAALAARKDFRTQRDYVDMRRAKVKIFDARRAIDAALATLKETAKSLDAREPSPKDFDDVRAATAALKKTVESSREFASQDPKFASYVNETEAAIAKQQKATDERWVLLSADKHRALVEEARQAFTTANAALNNGATDAQFKAADEAGTALTKRLDEGKPLEADKNYKGFADKTRAEIVAAKKKSDELWTATGLARLKAEIEPAYKDLVAAAKAVRPKKATEDQLAEARTAAIVVRKLVEKFAPEAARSQAFGQYVETVKSTLNEVESNLQLRALEAAQRDVTQALRKVEAKSPTDEQFTEAANALAVLEKTLAPMNPKEPALTAFIGDGRIMLRDARASVNKRRVETGGAHQQEKLDAARQAFTTAMAGLSKGATDAQFKAADDAAADLGTRLEDGKPFEEDKTYKASADKGRLEVVLSKKKRDELWTATVLVRLKSELEPAYKDLVAAGRNVRSKKATADQLAEARTAAIVVRKLVEKFAPEAQKSEAFGVYVESVKSTLAEVGINLQLRALDAAQRDVSQALRHVEGKSPTDDHFAEATSALLVLEKTLDPMNAKDPALTAFIGDGKIMLRDGRTTVAKRRIETDVERQKAKVEEARRKAEVAMGALGQPNFGNDAIQAAEASLVAIGAALEAGSALGPKDREYAAYDREVHKRITDSTAKIAAKKIALAGREGRALLTEGLNDARAKIDVAKQPGSTDADLEAAGKAVESLQQAIEAHAPLEQQDYGYAAHSVKVWNALPSLQEKLDAARVGRELRKRTGEALAAGAAASDAAAASQDLKVQKTQYEKALVQFKGCKDEAGGLEGKPQLASLVVLIDGRPSTAKEVVVLCAQRAEATAALIKPLVGLIAVDDGPKKAFEKATALVKQGKKTDAVAQFDECTATGIIVQYRSPELKDHSFQVGGGAMTLSEMIKECTAQSKSLRGK